MADSSSAVPACPICGSAETGHTKDDHPFVIANEEGEPFVLTVRIRGNSETERGRMFALAKREIKKHFPKKKLSFTLSLLETSQALTYASVVSYFVTED